MTPPLLGNSRHDQDTLFAAPMEPERAHVDRAAVLSDCRQYRYLLTRTWDYAKVPCMFIGLNPSTADAWVDDPTIRRCIRFARDWGHGGLVMLNLFAWRATDPKELYLVEDPIGPKNEEYLREWSLKAGRTIAAWGAHTLAPIRANHLRFDDTIGPYDVLGRTKAGHPRHPLYMKADTWPQDGLTGVPALPTCASCGFARELYDSGDTCDRCVLKAFEDLESA